ncbi:MAG: hypothetical protein NTU78_05465, partial [Alphaproteobacteria bacterium]|nr:hypothetical protein [Alphaproteobacteria bacterium]
PSAKQRQLENNLTKSLLTILENADRGLFLKMFLKRFAKVPFCREVGFSLQRCPALADNSIRRRVVAITGRPADLVKGDGRKALGIPDAWIWSAGWTVLVESKIGATLSQDQLEAHARRAGWRPKTYKTVRCTWSQIYEAFKSLSPKDRVSRLLMEHWLAYVEHLNMAQFERLDDLDFNLQNLAPQDRRAMLPRVKVRLRTFAKLLSEKSAARKAARHYKGKWVKNWKFGDTWFNLGGEQSSKTWHISIALRPEGIDVELLANDKTVIRRLCDSGVDPFREIVRMAGKHRELQLCCRRAWYKNPDSPYKGIGVEHVDHPMLVQPSVLGEATQNQYAGMLRDVMRVLLQDRRFRTELVIRREIPRSRLLKDKISAAKQAGLVADAVHHLSPILDYLMRVTTQ